MAGYDLNLSDVLQLLGVGSKDNFWEVFMGVVFKIFVLLLQDIDPVLQQFGIDTSSFINYIPSFQGVYDTTFTAAESNLYDSLLDPVLSGMNLSPSGYVSNGTFNLNTDIA